MDINEKKEKLQKKLAEKLEQQKKSKDEVSALKKQLAALDRPGANLTRAQQNSVKIWHGLAAMDYIKKNPESDFAKFAHDYFDKNIKSARQRKIFDLPELEKQAENKSEKRFSNIFERDAPIFAMERIDLSVPYSMKEKVKKLGARWDGHTWYVLEGFDLTLVEEWLPKDRDWRIYGLI